MKPQLFPRNIDALNVREQRERLHLIGIAPGAVQRRLYYVGTQLHAVMKPDTLPQGERHDESVLVNRPAFRQLWLVPTIERRPEQTFGGQLLKEF